MLFICTNCDFWGGRGNRFDNFGSVPLRGVFGIYKPIKPISNKDSEYLITHLRRFPKDLPKISPKRAEKFVLDLLVDYLECEVRAVGGTKDNRYKYNLSDIVIKYTTQGGTSSGGCGMWSSTTYRESETLEYTLETFYSIRLEKRRKPSIKWHESINKKSFENIDREINAITESLKQAKSHSDTQW